MHLGSLKSTQETRVPQGALLRFFFALQTSHVPQHLMLMLKHESIVYGMVWYLFKVVDVGSGYPISRTRGSC